MDPLHWVLMLVLLVLYDGRAYLPNPHQLAGLIAAMKDKFQARRIHIVTGITESFGLGVSRDLVILQKELALHLLHSHHIYAEGFSNERVLFGNGSRISRSMYVFISDPSVSRNILQNVSSHPGWRFTTLLPLLGKFLFERNPVWLVWLEDGLSHFFSRMVIPINCHFYVAQYSSEDEQVITLTEVYHIDASLPLQTHVCGNYNTISGSLAWTTVPFFERRGDLQGIRLTGLTTHNPPQTIVDTSGGGTRIRGPFGRFWELLEHKMNFTTVYKKNKMKIMYEGIEQVWGSIGDVFVMDYPLVWSGEYIFTSPIFMGRYNVYIRKPDEQGPGWSTYLYSFTFWLWFCYAFLILFLAASVAFFFKAPGTNSFIASLFDILGVITMQGSEESSRKLSLRILYLSLYLTAVTMSAAYSANIIAHLTVKPEVLPFHDLEGMFNSKEYKFGVTWFSGEEMVLVFTHDPVFATMYASYRDKYKKRKRDIMPMNIREGLEEVCASQYAFFARHDQVLANSDGLPCTVSPLPAFYLNLNIAMCVRRDLPYLDLMNFHITKIRTSGLSSYLFQKSDAQSKPESANPQVYDVELQNIKSILSLLAVFTVVAIICLILEIKYKASMRKSTLMEEEIRMSR